VLMDDHVRAVKRSVHRRKCAQTCHRGFHEKRHKRQFGLVALLEFFFRFGAQDRYFGHVNFIDRIHVRGNMFGGHHVLGDPLPHGAHGLHSILPELNFFGGHGGSEAPWGWGPEGPWAAGGGGCGGSRTGPPAGIETTEGAAAGALPAPAVMTASMSSLLMRPPAPVPGTVERSMPCSLAMRRTSGEL